MGLSFFFDGLFSNIRIVCIPFSIGDTKFALIMTFLQSKVCVSFTSDILLNNEESSANNFILASLYLESRQCIVRKIRDQEHTLGKPQLQ